MYTVDALFRRCRSDRGFTLIEIIGVLVILGILAAVVSHSVDTRQETLSGELDTLKANLRYAQSLGFSQAYLPAGSAPIVWGINAANNTYTLQRNGAAQANVFLPGTNSATHTMPSTINISTASVHFNFRGVPTDAAGNVSGADTTFTLSFSDGGHSMPATVTRQTGFVQ